MGQLVRSITSNKSAWCDYLVGVARAQNATARVSITDGSTASPGFICIEWDGVPDVDAAALLDAFISNPPPNPEDADKALLQQLAANFFAINEDSLTTQADAITALRTVVKFLKKRLL